MNDIDDIFKDAVSDQEKAVFKPEYWEQFNQQMSNSNLSKNRKGLMVFLIIGILVSALGVILIQSNDLETNLLSFNNGNKNEIDKNKIITYKLAESKEEYGKILEEKKTNDTDNELITIPNTFVAPFTKFTQVDKAIEESNSYDQNLKKDNSTTTDLNNFNKENHLGNNTNTFQNNNVSVEILDIVSNEIEKDKGNNSLQEADKFNQKNEVEPKVKDSLINNQKLEPKKKSSEVTKNKLKLFQMYFQFGGIAYNDFSLNEKSKNFKSGLLAGIGVEYLLKPSLTLSLGVNGYNRTSETLQLKSNFNNKGFGEVDSKKTYTYSDLYFLEVPVNLNYYFNSRHKIGGGPVFTRLLTSKVHVQEEVKEMDKSSESVSNSNSFLYHYNTFELNNLGVNLNYQYSFNRIGVEVGFTHGLNEFLIKETFNSNRFNSLNKIQVSIKYKL